MVVTRTVFDQASRRLALADPVTFFTWLLKRYTQELHFTRWLQTRTTPTPGDPEQVGDTVAEMAATDAGPPWLLVLEFQTEPDSKMFSRLSVQGGHLWEEHRPDELPDSRYRLCGAVVNLTGTRASAPASRSYRCPADDDMEWTIKVKEVYVSEQVTDSTLSRVENGELGRGILPLVVLMQGADDPANIQRWLDAVNLEPDMRRRGELAGLTSVFADLKDWSAAWKQALKGVSMRESVTVNEWKREAVVEALQQTLSSLLLQRFNGVPQPVQQQIDSTQDPAALKRGIVQVLSLAKPEDLTL